MTCGKKIRVTEITVAVTVNKRISLRKSPPKYSKEFRPDMCIICLRPAFFSVKGINAYIPAVKMLLKIRKNAK